MAQLNVLMAEYIENEKPKRKAVAEPKVFTKKRKLDAIDNAIW